MKDFINREKMETAIHNICAMSLNDDDARKYESLIEEYAVIHAGQVVDDMKSYVHQYSTRMDGNFCDIRDDWNNPGFIRSEIAPWGRFDDVVKSIDDGKISDEDLEKFQTWAMDWFFTAFGTWGISYNFQTLVSEMEYEEEREKREEVAEAVA